MLLYPEDQLSELILLHGFELNERLFVQSLLRPNDTFVDIGANIGIFTLTAAKMITNRGQVLAFEPAKATFDRLTENVRLNHLRNVQCFQIALSNQSEKRILTTSVDGFAAWNSLAQPTAGGSFAQEHVQCVTWDELAETYDLNGKVTLMKIDIEGWELYALKGALTALSREDAPHLLVEFTDVNAQSAGTSCEALYRYLETLGYRMYGFDSVERNLWHEPLRARYPYENLLASKRIKSVIERSKYSLVQIEPSRL